MVAYDNSTETDTATRSSSGHVDPYHASHMRSIPPSPMSTDTTKIRSKLARLDESLDELESKLEPLFAKSLPETLLALDTIQQAKLQVIIPYVVYDLVFGKRARTYASRG